VAVSMAAVGKPEENGYAERLMRTIQEEVALSDDRDFADARRQLGRFLDAVYNRKRIHSALGYLTPLEFEQPWPARSGEPGVIRPRTASPHRRPCGGESRGNPRRQTYRNNWSQVVQLWGCITLDHLLDFIQLHGGREAERQVIHPDFGLES
jgi:hypothetical protein